MHVLCTSSVSTVSLQLSPCFFIISRLPLDYADDRILNDEFIRMILVCYLSWIIDAGLLLDVYISDNSHLMILFAVVKKINILGNDFD